ncbi:hypothetical protein NHX12_018046 [Muraenolepis orangiensis]|uniref:C2H2-type domain-containing protein n=1 Tax=Muraenolepis orangiensis TaxID=630683 RepID=A0A9Q0EW15_9TELE|nr:hypothetical protein NHX12_018046 [Muraenolepis orangiensis]
MMENYGNFHTQLVSIVEVLANAAVLEICKLVDDGFSRLRLEVSRTRRENLELTDRLRLLETAVIEHPSLAPKSAGAGGDGGCHAQQQGVVPLTSNPGSSHASRPEWAPSLCVEEEAATSVETTTEEKDEGPSFDAFDSLFSSPDVARSLNAPELWEAAAEERLASSYSSFLTPPSVAVGRRDPLPDSRGPRDPRCERVRFSSASGEPAPAPPHHAGLFPHEPFLPSHHHHHQHLPAHHPRLHRPPAAEHPFSCGVCGKHFSQSSHIKRHMSVHTGERRYGCSVCGKRFSQACSLKVHRAVHTGERPHGCPQCGKRFSLLGNLVRHQALHARK